MAKLLAPNGKPSNLTPEQYKLVRTPAFKEFFGDWENLILTKINDSGIDEVSLKRLEDGVSKIVDSNGEPLPVYHGTASEFNIFKVGITGGIFFSNNKNSAERFSIGDLKRNGEKPIILECFLKIKKYYDKNTNDEILIDDYYQDYFKNRPFINKTSQKNILKDKFKKYFMDLVFFGIVNKEPKQKLLKCDYDGIIIDADNNSKSFIVFESNQIKLADGTNNTFDVNNPDIRFEEGGSVIINPTEIECHKCHWKWKVKDGGDDLFICHKCYTDNSKFYKFEGLEGEKILDTISSNNNNPKNKFDCGGILDGLTEEQITYIDIISNYDGKGELAEKYKKVLKEKTGIDYDEYYGKIDNDLIKNADVNNIKTKNDFLNYDNWIKYSYEILRKRGFDKNPVQHIEGKLTFDKIKEFCDNLNISFEIIPENLGVGNYASHSMGTIKVPIGVDINTFIHEIGHFYDWKIRYEGIAKNPAYATSFYILRNANEVYAENFMHYFIANEWLKNNMPIVYEELDRTISLEYKKNILELINSLNYFKKGGRTIAQTPAPKKERIYGSEKNKSESSKDTKSADKIEFNEKTLETIKNKVAEHNEKNPKKKVNLASAKAVVRRGMGAYSSSYRPTISGGKPNNRVAWGLARLNAFLYKIVNGKSKSGKYSQDNDLIEELGYNVDKYEIGGVFHGSSYYFDKFNTDKIGSGIGQQQDGWGIYLTDDKESSKNYGNYIYETTLFNGKNLDEYTFLDLNKPIKKDLVEKIIEPFQKLGFNVSEILEFDYMGFLFYKTLSRKLGGDKKASLFLLNNGIDGLKRSFENSEGVIYRTDYVIFDENAITIENKEYLPNNYYADGGDIQAYEEAMDITYSEGGETKPKKVYVSIRLDNESKKIPNTFNEYFSTYSEQPFEELKNGVLKGLVGVSSSPNNIAEWFIHRDCLIVMDYKEFIAINETETINYYDPYQLMKNNLYLFKRLYANVGARSSNEEGSYVFIQTLVKILEKIVREINLEMNLAEGQKYSELYRISRFLSPYETSAFPDWIEENKIKIESPIDLTNAILDFNKLNVNASYLGYGFENSVLTFDELLPVIEKGVTNASSIYDSEQEIVLNNRELNIPKNSQLFFIAKDEVGNTRESNRDELIEKYNLKELYKVYFVDRKEIQKYRDFWVKKEEEKFNNKLEQGRKELELKKEQVLNELLNYFLEKSITYVKNELEKEIIEYNESLDFYDETDDNYVEQNLFSIRLVVSLMNTYVLIIKNFWKSFIQKKQVKDLNIYAFDMFYFNVKQELKNYFENKKDELEKLNNYRNVRGSGSLDRYRFERLLLKTIDDYENLPELIDYKELSKMYLDKMGRELYRYYDKKDLPLISQYKDGGETDEPTEFWGTEAGGVLVYCSTTERYLILLRSEWVLEPNTWGIISGKLDDEENVQEAVLREAQEETGYKLGNLIPSFIFEKPNFKFHNFVSIVEEEFTPELDWENSDYRWVKLNEMPENLHFGLKLLLQKEDLPKLIQENKNNKMENKNTTDTITMNVPLLIRFAELMREEVKSDVQLHKIIENMLKIKDNGILSMKDYDSIIGNEINSEQEEPKMEEGGKVESIHSSKGDIKLSLEENWYSDDTDVELVPVSELIKFREFDRKVSPKYNKENSVDNINHLKFMFQKDGVKSPLIIEYSKEDNAVLIIEGNHRLNSAIDLGMEYLPARVVLKKYSKFSKSQLKNAMKVSGVEGDQYGYIPSNMKPSKVGIQGTMPIYADGGIIKGRLHSECGDDGCGRKFQVGENGHVIEAERDEAVIVADAFNDNEKYTIKGTPSEVASALNVMGGGKNFDKGASIIKKGQELEIPELKKEATDTDVKDVIDSGSIIINRRSMADTKKYEVTGTTKQIASAINSINGNGVVIEKGAEIK